ncbi:divergent PAP2 family protein [Patescibacteria group bacterium]|nr:divergent PAP2 family protein [Patescibacteria group bacterium]
MSLLQELLRTYLFLIPLVVLILSEVAKLAIDRFNSGNWKRTLFQHGGFPSTHSAFVTSLLIVVGRKTGLDSVEFAIAAVFAAFVWYDAVAIRSEIDEQAKALNFLQHVYKFSEEVGHSLAEVLAGIGFGAIVTLIGIWIS